MESLLQLLQSYTNARLVVLRTLTNSQVSCPYICQATDLTVSMIRGRQRNATLWRPNELGQLASMLSLPNRFADHLNSVSQQLTELPPSQLQKLQTLTKLNVTQLAQRKQDYRLWQYNEIERLLSSLRMLCEASNAQDELFSKGKSRRRYEKKGDLERMLRATQ
ncbi:hypothetical protein ACFSUS_22790 [Spirosoma soli]|uniref:Uncharacterized protein n=1 Tax=Spirosoma soli TaxID=1770529 RepID=A0ABW5M8Y9_9BACT